jgi:hypothetical protein
VIRKVKAAQPLKLSAPVSGVDMAGRQLESLTLKEAGCENFDTCRTADRREASNQAGAAITGCGLLMPSSEMVGRFDILPALRRCRQTMCSSAISGQRGAPEPVRAYSGRHAARTDPAKADGRYAQLRICDPVTGHTQM